MLHPFLSKNETLAKEQSKEVSKEQYLTLVVDLLRNTYVLLKALTHGIRAINRTKRPISGEFRGM